MEYTYLIPNSQKVSRVGLGTWVFGGDMWGKTAEADALNTVRKALDSGITLIDTAPIYGYGRSEEIVGKAIAEFGKREDLVIATKFGLSWKNEKTCRDGSRENIFREVEDSLRRLHIDSIDLYQMHWPDPMTPVQETAEAVHRLYQHGKIRAIGLSNFSVEEIIAFQEVAPVHSLQVPYNIFEREIESDLLPFCRENDIPIVAYSSLCRGLLTGKITKDYQFQEGDFRKTDDPKFQPPRLFQYLSAVERLDQFAQDRFGKHVIHLAIRWILDQGVDVALWGARHPDQLNPLGKIFGWSLSADDIHEIDTILEKTIQNPVGAEFLAPPIRAE